MLVTPTLGVHAENDDGMTFPYLTIGRVYVVVGIEDDMFRLVVDNGDPALIPRGRCIIVDAWIPENWNHSPHGLYGLHEPPEVSSSGFYEKWHDGDSAVRQVFEKVFRRLWQHYASAEPGYGAKLQPRVPSEVWE